MSDYIRREDAIVQLSVDFSNLELPKIKDSIDKIPSADVREIIKVEAEPTKGEWEFFDYPYMGYRCSKCGAIGNYDHKFCHDCGIEMKVEPTEE